MNPPSRREGAGLRAATIDPNAFGGSLQRPELSKLALAAAAVSELPCGVETP